MYVRQRAVLKPVLKLKPETQLFVGLVRGVRGV